MNGDDFFTRMTREAVDELASGQKSWKEVDTNTLLLACFGMLGNHMTSRIVRPLWFFASTVFAGVIWLVVSRLLGLK